LAVAYAAAGHDVTLWARDAEALAAGESPRLPAVKLPENVRVTGDLQSCDADIALIAIPTQSMGRFPASANLRPRVGGPCAKGVS